MRPSLSSQCPMSVLFDQDQSVLWPALLILRQGRPNEPSRSLVQRFSQSLHAQRMGADDIIDTRSLKAPASEEDVIDWLLGVWRILESANNSGLSKRRRSILNEILQCGFSMEGQAGLVTALDYLFRLSSARRAAQSSRVPAKATLPRTRCPSMQTVYRKLAGLTATDLPIWFAGEKGCEFDWMARLAHQLRGLPDSSLHVRSFDGEQPEMNSFASDREEGILPNGPEVTVFIKDVDTAPLEIQRSICNRLVSDMNRVPSCRIIVSTGPWSLRDDPPKTVLHDLFAFLAPTRIQIPPLRARSDDLPDLIDFVARKCGENHFNERISEDASRLLHDYHWPGNIDELSFVLSFIVKKRPAGSIRPDDLPETLQMSTHPERMSIMHFLENNFELQGFRTIRTSDGRDRLAAFLSDPEHEVFSAGDVQTALRLGRETARRLLRSLETSGLIEGIKGSGGIRTTRYTISLSNM
ncbi:MAG: hypothetical protein HY912_10775 [Desulfomonile tiedjei]|uniref:Sigma-54 factor interaction domain-containing protein n=1 Tax=Desulfomonile tiedjei TaxID=2358 RepID=A0A9D6V0S5_9BACT|nr:hypothetical protein [Desulfomonile tiedjei]